MTSESSKTLAIKLLVMALSSLATYLHITLPGSEVLDFSTDAVTGAIILYGWYRAYGKKLVPRNSVAIHPDDYNSNPKPMRVLGAIAIGFIITGGAYSARAADVLPAPSIATACSVATASTPLSCSGFYVGGGLAGNGSNADIIGNGINGSVFAGGMTPTLDAGYQYMQGNWIFGGEIDIGYALGGNASIDGVGIKANGFRVTELLKAGGNINALFGTQSPITIPPSLANSVLGLYVAIGDTQWFLPGTLANGFVSGAGLEYDISPKIFGDLRYTYTNFNGAKSGGLTIANDQELLATINYKF